MDNGPFASIPVAIKDLIDVAGCPTRAGSAAFHGAVPAPHDAPVVATLRGAGASIVGKTALHEIAFGTTGINVYEGTPANPHDPKRICGGSSSGSAAAVAEGSAVFALGTDTGGSIRIPAAFCGVVGFKPQFGSLSLRGVQPLAKSLDHVGVMGADVATVASAFAVLRRAPLVDHTLRRVIALDHVGLESSSDEVASAIEASLGSLSDFEVTSVDLPDPDLIDAASTAVLFVEAAKTHSARLFARPASSAPMSANGSFSAPRSAPPPTSPLPPRSRSCAQTYSVVSKTSTPSSVRRCRSWRRCSKRHQETPRSLRFLSVTRGSRTSQACQRYRYRSRAANFPWDCRSSREMTGTSSRWRLRSSGASLSSVAPRCASRISRIRSLVARCVAEM